MEYRAIPSVNMDKPKDLTQEQQLQNADLSNIRPQVDEMLGKQLEQLPKEEQEAIKNLVAQQAFLQDGRDTKLDYATYDARENKVSIQTDGIYARDVFLHEITNNSEPNISITNPVREQIDEQIKDALQGYTPEHQEVMKTALAEKIIAEYGTSANVGEIIINAKTGLLEARVDEFYDVAIDPKDHLAASLLKPLPETLTDRGMEQIEKYGNKFAKKEVDKRNEDMIKANNQRIDFPNQNTDPKIIFSLEQGFKIVGAAQKTYDKKYEAAVGIGKNDIDIMVGGKVGGGAPSYFIEGHGKFGAFGGDIRLRGRGYIKGEGNSNIFAEYQTDINRNSLSARGEIFANGDHRVSVDTTFSNQLKLGIGAKNISNVSGIVAYGEFPITNKVTAGSSILFGGNTPSQGTINFTYNANKDLSFTTFYNNRGGKNEYGLGVKWNTN